MTLIPLQTFSITPEDVLAAGADGVYGVLEVGIRLVADFLGFADLVAVIAVVVAVLWLRISKIQ